MGEPRRTRVVFAGAGHAALIALQHLARRPPDAEVTLLSRSSHAHYSGMVPGWIEGIYASDDLAIPLEPFARSVGARFVSGEIAAADAASFSLADGRRLAYDIAVINTGSETRREGVLASPRVIPAKPFETLIDGLGPTLDRAGSFAVIGGGVAGVEIALALRHRRRHAPVTLLERSGTLLAGTSRRFGRRVAERLAEAAVDVRTAAEIVAVEHRALTLRGGERVDAGAVIALTGPRAPSWLDVTPFERAQDGFIAIDDRLRSLSHPHVFAVGDVATREDDPRPKAGVFAVRAGPHLANAVRAAMEGAAPPRVRLQRKALVLLSTGGRNAIGVRNGIVFEGGWVWRWKDRLDRGFVARFAGAGA